MSENPRRADACFTDILFFGLVIEVLAFIFIIAQSLYDGRFYYGTVASAVAAPLLFVVWKRERRLIKLELEYLRELEIRAQNLPPLNIPDKPEDFRP